MYNPSNYHPGQEIKHYQYPSEAPMSFLITISSLPTPRVNQNFDFQINHFLALFIVLPPIHASEILWFSFAWSLFGFCFGFLLLKFT